MFNVDNKRIDKYKALIKLVESCGATSAYVAGGAVRDMLFQKPIRDIDVFYNGDLDLDKVKAAFPQTFNGEDDFGWFGVGVPYQDKDWKVTHPTILWDELKEPIQFIQVEGSIFEHFDTFGCTLSQVWCGRTVVSATGKFFDAAASKKLVWVGEPGDNYKNKIKAKYKEYDWEGKTPKKLIRYLNREESATTNG